MRDYTFTFQRQTLVARAAATLWWPEQGLLCVSDMHLGKSERIARKGGALLPPFETQDTLARLGEEIARLSPDCVVCLGDSFDDLKALDSLNDADHKALTAMIAGREWIWIEGNHDSGPVDIGGSHMRDFARGGLNFRHIADPNMSAEISGHYHPKARVSARGSGMSRPSFLIDQERIIMPAFGTYTGGLLTDHAALVSLMQKGAKAVLTGQKAIPIPLR